MKYIKSLIYLIGTYLLIAVSLTIFGGWDFKDALLLIKADSGMQGIILSTFLIISILISTSLSSSTRPNKKFWGYFVFPFISAFIILSLAMSNCWVGMMGCGLNLLVAIFYALLIYILCVVNFWLSSK